MVPASMACVSGWVATKRRQGHVGQTASRSERPLHGPLQRFDLGAEVGRLMEEGAWQRGQRNSITLRKDEGMSVVLLGHYGGSRA